MFDFLLFSFPSFTFCVKITVSPTFFETIKVYSQFFLSDMINVNNNHFFMYVFLDRYFSKLAIVFVLLLYMN